MIEIQYSGTALLLPMHTAIKQLHHVPHLRIYRLKRKHFVASYAVHPFMQQYESTFKKEKMNGI